MEFVFPGGGVPFILPPALAGDSQIRLSCYNVPIAAKLMKGGHSMGGAILRFLVTVAAIPLCGEFMDGVHIAELSQGLLLGAALGVIYLLLRPLVRLITSVFNFCTLGLLHVVLDAFLVWTAAGFFRPGVQLDSVWWALAVAAVINVLRFGIDLLSGKGRK